MVCTYCGGKTQVVNSRHQVKSNQVWRRRQCLACKALFTSEEKVEFGLAWVVCKHGSFEPFSRDKLLLSLYKCCEHRKNPLSDAQGLTETIMNKLPGLRVDDTPRTLLHSDIARISLVALNRFDTVAGIRYLSLHGRYGRAV